MHKTSMNNARSVKVRASYSFLNACDGSEKTVFPVAFKLSVVDVRKQKSHQAMTKEFDIDETSTQMWDGSLKQLWTI